VPVCFSIAICVDIAIYHGTCTASPHKTERHQAGTPFNIILSYIYFAGGAGTHPLAASLMCRHRHRGVSRRLSGNGGGIFARRIAAAPSGLARRSSNLALLHASRIYGVKSAFCCMFASPVSLLFISLAASRLCYRGLCASASALGA